MIILFALFLLSLLVVTALAIVRTENLFVAVMLTSIFSLLMAANFFILDAADVALTEAAVGAGVTTVIFLGALALTAEREKYTAVGGRVAVVVVAVLAALIIYATFDKPRLGDPDAPVHQHLAPWYLEKTPELIDIPNVVTAVLGSFRGYDTLGEVFVVFAACIGVLFILGVQPADRSTLGTDQRRPQAPPHPAGGGKAADTLHHLVWPVCAISRGVRPGWWFPGGCPDRHGHHSLCPAGGRGSGPGSGAQPVLMGLVIGGACLYGGVGLLCILLGGNFLDYSVLASDPVTGQQVGILLIEAGVGMAVCGALLSIFHAFAARPIRL